MDIVDFTILKSLYTEAGARSAFEMMVGELLGEEDDQIKPMRANPGDGGIDCYDLNKGHVYQVKYFAGQIGRSQRDQVQSSFKKAQDTMGPDLKKWILVIPKDLDQEEVKWFQSWSVKKVGVSVDWLGATKLSSLLAKYAWIQNRYFKSGVERILRRIVVSQDALIGEIRAGFDRVARPLPNIHLMCLRSERDKERILQECIEDGGGLIPREDLFRMHQEYTYDMDDFLRKYTRNYADQVNALTVDVFTAHALMSTISEQEVIAICQQYEQDRLCLIGRVESCALLMKRVSAGKCMKFQVVNDGSIPAENVDVLIDLEHATAMTEGDVLEQYMATSHLVATFEALGDRLHKAASIYGRMGRYGSLDGLGLGGLFPPDLRLSPSLIRCNQDGHSISLREKKVDHGGSRRGKDAPMCVFVFWEGDEPYSASYAIHCDNYPGSFEGRIEM